MKKTASQSNKETKNNEVINARADAAEVKKYKLKTKDKAEEAAKSTTVKKQKSS